MSVGALRILWEQPGDKHQGLGKSYHHLKEAPRPSYPAPPAPILSAWPWTKPAFSLWGVSSIRCQKSWFQPISMVCNGFVGLTIKIQDLPVIFGSFPASLNIYWTHLQRRKDSGSRRAILGSLVLWVRTLHRLQTTSRRVHKATMKSHYLSVCKW